MCVRRLFVGLSDDRWIVVPFLVFVFLVFFVLVIVGISRRHRIAHDGNEPPVDQPGGNDIPGHVGSCWMSRHSWTNISSQARGPAKSLHCCPIGVLRQRQVSVVPRFESAALGLRVSHCARRYYMVGAEQGANSAVAVRTREIYRSANGDRWLLACDPDTARVFVRHEPNLPSGGQVADIEIGAFLIAAGNGPEKQELLRLIGTLVKGPAATRP